MKKRYDDLRLDDQDLYNRRYNISDPPVPRIPPLSGRRTTVTSDPGSWKGHIVQYDKMREWDTTLRDAYVSPNSRRYHRKVPPPAVLEPILPLIAELVNLDRRTEIEDALKRVAPPPPYEQIPYEYMEHCYEATMLSGVIDRALTLKALQTIASKLNDTERSEVVTWAQAQALIMYRDGKPENLCGDKYLQVELPSFDVPSLLEFSALDESLLDGNHHEDKTVD